MRIASKPHALTWRNFISREEARHIVELAAPLMKRSGVGDVSASVENTVRRPASRERAESASTP